MTTNRRYPASLMIRARELRDAGWTLERVCDLIEGETGLRPAKTTVALWCYSDSKRARRATQKRAQFEKAQARRAMDWRIARMRELHEAGMSHLSIAQAAGVLWGETISADGVRSRLKVDSARRSYQKAATA